MLELIRPVTAFTQAMTDVHARIGHIGGTLLLIGAIVAVGIPVFVAIISAFVTTLLANREPYPKRVANKYSISRLRLR